MIACANVSRRSARSWRSRLIRVLYRRYVCTGDKRGRHVGPTRRGKGTKIMAIADGAGLPLAICTASASPNEVTLVDQTIESRFIDEVPRRLIGDKAYDSDPLDERLRCKYGIEMISPNRASRKRKTQDGRPLGATDGAGKSNGSSHGLPSSAEPSSDRKLKSKTSSASSTSLASKYCYAIFRYAYPVHTTDHNTYCLSPFGFWHPINGLTPNHTLIPYNIQSHLF